MTVSIGLASTLLLEAGGKRGIYLSNRGENTVWLKFGESAVVGEGIPRRCCCLVTDAAIAWKLEWLVINKKGG